MYTQKPVGWFDVNRIRPEEATRLFRDHGMVPAVPGQFPPMGYVMPRYPTPEELFWWHPRMTDA